VDITNLNKKVELMAVIQTIDNYWNNSALKFFNKKLFQCKYKENIEKYFEKYKNHETITLHNKLWNNVQDISTFINFVLCYSSPPEFYNIANSKNNLPSGDIQFTCEELINERAHYYRDIQENGYTIIDYIFVIKYKNIRKMSNPLAVMDWIECMVVDEAGEPFLGETEDVCTVFLRYIFCARETAAQFLYREAKKLSDT
jgi:hypothetical protein